jgi:hypothetical protein
MFVERFAAILSSAESGQDLIGVEEAIGEYKKTAPYMEALARLTDRNYSVGATASLYEDYRFSLVETNDEWTALLAAPTANTSFIVTPSFFSLVHVAEAGGDMTLKRYAVEGYPIAGDLPGAMRAIHVGDEIIRAGSTFVMAGGPFAGVLKGELTSCRFLRFTRNTQFPYVFSFDDETLALRSTSFATTEQTSRQFYAVLLDELMKLDQDGWRMSEADRSPIRDFLAAELVSAEVDIITKWKIAQMLGRDGSSEVLAFLEATATGPLPRASLLAGQALALTAHDGG